MNKIIAFEGIEKGDFQKRLSLSLKFNFKFWSHSETQTASSCIVLSVIITTNKKSSTLVTFSLNVLFRYKGSHYKFSNEIEQLACGFTL